MEDSPKEPNLIHHVSPEQLVLAKLGAEALGLHEGQYGLDVSGEADSPEVKVKSADVVDSEPPEAA